MPHSDKPASHSIVHCPFTQAGVPFGGSGHARLHWPQFRGFVWRSTHSAPHLLKPGLQSKVQPVPVHLGDPFGGAEQTLLQLPQCEGCVGRTQEPPQSVLPIAHAGRHIPAWQT